jgi:hypothetical protein
MKVIQVEIPVVEQAINPVCLKIVAPVVLL